MAGQNRGRPLSCILFALLLTLTPGGSRAVVCRVCEETEAACDPVTRTCHSNCSRTKVCSADENCLATMYDSREGRTFMRTDCFGAAPLGPEADPRCTADFLRGMYTCTCRGDDCNNLMVLGGKLPWPGETPSDIWQNDNNEAILPNQPEFPNHPRNILSDRADNATENRTRAVETAVPCDTDKSCGGGKYCDRHYGVCKPRGRLGDLCRRDGNCQGGYDCMFGRCEKTIQAGEQGARCKHDKDCGDSMCCARQHGERICKRRLVLDQKCYVPDGGLDYSLNQMCPCEKGLICGEVPPPPREEEFILFTDNHHMRCKAIDE
ncbi:uncharacterized protein LOC144902298 isoform X1 [Branchiostoma floridae x Branchiostoma belcheri]